MNRSHIHSVPCAGILFSIYCQLWPFVVQLTASLPIHIVSYSNVLINCPTWIVALCTLGIASLSLGCIFVLLLIGNYYFRQCTYITVLCPMQLTIVWVRCALPLIRSGQETIELFLIMNAHLMLYLRITENSFVYKIRLMYVLSMCVCVCLMPPNRWTWSPN